MAETDWHYEVIILLRDMLAAYYAAQRRVYVSGNLLVFYEEGNPRRHVSPDVFVVKGVAKRQRGHYLIWREKKSLDLVIEATSNSTRREDLKDKFVLYQDVLRVREYFLFDPLAEYLDPPLQGYRLRKGLYAPIKAVDGRLPGLVLGLHLEGHDKLLRLYNPATGLWLPTPQEVAEQAEAARQQEAQARQQADAEVARLRREVAELRRRLAREDR
jgi:Uma2 family endonuclease